MKLKYQNVSHICGLKELGFDHLVDCVKQTLKANGANYFTIRQRMDVVYQFLPNAKKYGLRMNLSQIKDAYEDFFLGKQKINNLELIPNQSKVIYHIHEDDELVDDYKLVIQRTPQKVLNSLQQKHGISLSKITETKAALTDLDGEQYDGYVTANIGLIFTDEKIVYNETFNRYGANISRLERGNQVAFTFNQANQITDISYQRAEKTKPQTKCANQTLDSDDLDLILWQMKHPNSCCLNFNL